jgi:hypothetical protein
MPFSEKFFMVKCVTYEFFCEKKGGGKRYIKREIEEFFFNFEDIFQPLPNTRMN